MYPSQRTQGTWTQYNKYASTGACPSYWGNTQQSGMDEFNPDQLNLISTPAHEAHHPAGAIHGHYIMSHLVFIYGRINRRNTKYSTSLVPCPGISSGGLWGGIRQDRLLLLLGHARWEWKPIQGEGEQRGNVVLQDRFVWTVPEVTSLCVGDYSTGMQ